MDQCCVVVCGLQTGASDDASAWLPVAAALKLDPADFARRVVAALPRIVRRDLDRATAERVVQLLQAMHVDARALPDDPQLAYIDRSGSTRGPLPHASLGEFIQPGEWYRLHGDTAWLPWPAAEDEDAATPTNEPDAVDVDDAPSPAAHDEPLEIMSAPPSPDAINDVSDAAPEASPIVIDDEPHKAMPPPLPAPPAVQQPAPPGGPEVTEPTMDVGESAHDDELINPMNEIPAAVDPDNAAPLVQAPAEPTAPARSRTGRILLLLVLVVLAVWAYRHWMADTQTGDSPATPAAIQPVIPARVTPGDEPASAPAASVAIATSVSTAATTKTPATASSAPAKAGTTATPPAAAPARAPTIAAAAAMIPAGSSSAPPASASVPARQSPAVATSAARPATSMH